MSGSERTRSPKDGLYKISDLARETGVSTATIKFYIREGLLPSATLKTGRNMAYYDHSFVERIRLIKELQQKRFLPLDVIKAIVDRDEGVISPQEVDTLLGLEGTFYEAIHLAPGGDAISREEAVRRYDLETDDLDRAIASGVFTPVVRDGVEYFEGEDVQILEVLSGFEKSGFTRERFPSSVALPMYIGALEKLAREELKFFTQSVTGQIAASELAEMAMAGMKHGEQLMVLLRRKMMLKAIQELRFEKEEEETQAAS